MFRSWIPSSFGRVSFSHIGDANRRGHRERRNFEDGHRRYALVAETRVTRDSPSSAIGLQGLIDRFAYQRSNKFDFTLCGKTADDGAISQDLLRGYIFLNSPLSVAYDQFKIRERNLFFELEQYEQTCERKVGWLDLRATAEEHCSFDEVYVTAIDNLKEAAQFFTEFELNRDGRITFIKASLTCELDLRRWKRSYPTDEEAAASLYKCIAQAYIFAKDVSHTHTHHSPKTDSILDVYATTAIEDRQISKVEDGKLRYQVCAREGALEDNDKWRQEVLYALHRKVSAMQLRHDPAMLSSALGIVKYSSVFSSKFAPLLEGGPSWPNYDLSNGGDIIAALRQEIISKDHTTNEAQSLVLTIFAAFIGLLISYISILEIAGHEAFHKYGIVPEIVNPTLISTAIMFLRHPSWVVTTVITVISLIYYRTFTGIVSRTLKGRDIRNSLTRFYISVWMPTRVRNIITGLLAMAVALLIFVVAIPAVIQL